MNTVAMPIVASGAQAFSVDEMLPPLIDAAVHWMLLGLPLKRLKIAVYRDCQIKSATALFAQLKLKYQHPDPIIKTKQESIYDVFISYAHEDKTVADMIVNELRTLQPDIRIFLDRLNINVGAAWQPAIFEAIDVCNKIVVLFSPFYLQSKVCKEEYNIGWVRSREQDQEYLFPIYITSASLPTYMKYRLYIDCRECNKDKLKAACNDLISSFKLRT